MQTNDSSSIVLFKNIKNLVPYIGILLVIAGIIGLVFIQNPLKTSQDLRGEAVGTNKPIIVGAPFIKPELRVPSVVNKTGEAAFYLNSANYTFVEVNVVFSIINDSLDTPEISVNPGSGFDAKSIEIEQIQDGYLVKIVAVPNHLNWLVQPSDTSLIRMKLIPHTAGNIIVSFDQERTYANAQSSKILVQVPSPLKYTISTPKTETDNTAPKSGLDKEKQCTQSGGIWKQFPNSCADHCGVEFSACLDVLTMGCDCGATECWNGTSCTGYISNTPTPTPTATPPIDCSTFKTSEACSSHALSYCAWYSCASECHPRGTPTQTVCPPKPVQGCNQICASNSECKVNMLCYPINGEHRCRLATNPTSSACQIANNNEAILSSCNESCVSNAKCKTGLTCWNSTCRNPENPQSSSCAAPSSQQTATTIKQCGQSCASNANCAINLRCYEGECRLATNPSSTSCSAVTKQTVSTTYSNKVQNATTSADVANSDTPLKKGDNLIPDEELDVRNQESADVERLQPDASVESDETLLGLFKNLVKNSESKLPFFIILFGIMLLILSIFAVVLGRLRKPKKNIEYHPTKVNPSEIDIKTYNVKPDLENQQKD